MQFQVPQFIEVEDKIFGPLTIKQFIYLAGGGGLSFLLYSLLPTFIAIIIILPIIAFSLALAFYKINNKPFITIVEAAFKYLVAGKLYIWKKEDKKPVPATIAEEAAKATSQFSGLMVPKISESKLKDLTWSLDIKESIYSNKNQR